MSRIAYKTVDNFRARGIIVTSETIMDLNRAVRVLEKTCSKDAVDGARHIVDFLEECYNKNFKYR